jgi:hypothetical protein
VLQTLPLLFFSLTSNQTPSLARFIFSQQRQTQNYTQAFVKLKKCTHDGVFGMNTPTQDQTSVNLFFMQKQVWVPPMYNIIMPTCIGHSNLCLSKTWGSNA